jgi:hypothetical protein
MGRADVIEEGRIFTENGVAAENPDPWPAAVG